jgi:hypothetical protein
MKKTVLAVTIGWLLGFGITKCAHADSISDYIQFRAGVGVSQIRDMGDGIWIQEGAPHNHEQTRAPAFMAGFTGPIYQHGAFDVRWNLDYVYMGGFSAGVDGVPDENYNPQTHKVVGYTNPVYSVFNGQGHLQGVPVTLDVGYTWHGLRFAAEAGAWAYWQTWHESLLSYMVEEHDLSHKTVMQIGYVVGASVSRGPLSLSYRYYQTSGHGNPYPGIATNVQTLMMTYRF